MRPLLVKPGIRQSGQVRSRRIACSQVRSWRDAATELSNKRRKAAVLNQALCASHSESGMVVPARRPYTISATGYDSVEILATSLNPLLNHDS